MKKENRKVQALEAVALFIAEQGYPPSYRDLGEYMGTSHSLVYGIVKELRADGLIDERPPQTSRAITLTPAGRAAIRSTVRSHATDTAPD